MQDVASSVSRAQLVCKMKGMFRRCDAWLRSEGNLGMKNVTFTEIHLTKTSSHFFLKDDGSIYYYPQYVEMKRMDPVSWHI